MALAQHGLDAGRDGDISSAIQSCERVLELLKDVVITGLSFNERIKKSAMDMHGRLKQQ